MLYLELSNLNLQSSDSRSTLGEQGVEDYREQEVEDYREQGVEDYREQGVEDTVSRGRRYREQG